jgi:hypothetical protein
MFVDRYVSAGGRIADQAGSADQPVLVPMSEAGRSSAVAGLTEILAA